MPNSIGSSLYATHCILRPESTSEIGLVDLLHLAHSHFLPRVLRRWAHVLFELLTGYYLIFMLVLLWFVPPQAAAPAGLLERWSSLRWIGVVLVPLVAIVILASALVKRRRITFPLFLIPAAAFGLIIIVSGVANRSSSSLFDICGTLSLYLRYPLLFWALLVSPVSRSHLIWLLRVFAFLIGVQIVEAFVRHYFMNVTGDNISWLLGPWGASPLGVYGAYAICLIGGAVASRRWKIRYIALALLPLSLAVLGQIRGLLLAGPACLAWIFIFPQQNRRRLAINLGLVAAVATIGIVGIAMTKNSLWTHDTDKGVNPIDRVIKDPFSIATYENFPRIGTMIDSIKGLDNAGLLWLGRGPGSSLPRTASGSDSPLYAFDKGQGRSQIAAMAWDTGIVGLTCYAAMLLILLWLVARKARNEDETQTWLSLAVWGMWLFYAILAPVYNLSWRDDAPSFLFWTLLAALFAKSIYDYPASRPAGGVIDTRHEQLTGEDVDGARAMLTTHLCQ